MDYLCNALIVQMVIIYLLIICVTYAQLISLVVTFVMILQHALFVLTTTTKNQIILVIHAQLFKAVKFAIPLLSVYNVKVDFI